MGFRDFVFFGFRFCWISCFGEFRIIQSLCVSEFRNWSKFFFGAFNFAEFRDVPDFVLVDFVCLLEFVFWKFHLS